MTAAVAIVIALSACGGGESTDEALQTPESEAAQTTESEVVQTPEYTVIDQQEASIVAETAATDPDELRAIFDAVRAGVNEGDSWMVSINCPYGYTAGAEPRLANGRFALTQLGLAQTGLASVDDVDFEVLQGAQCQQAPATPAGPTTQQLLDAIQSAGLPATNPRDTTPNCIDFDCTSLITTDEVSLFQFIDETAAERYVTAGRPSARQGLLVVAFDRQTPEEQAAYAEVLANLSS